MSEPTLGLSRWSRSMALLLLIAAPWMSRAQFLYVTNSGSITITGYNGGGAVLIPNAINGFPVSRIATNAFAANDAITMIAIPTSITNIGAIAFGSCDGLTNIVVDPANQQYSSSNGALLNRDQTILIQFPGGAGGTFIVPQTVAAIADQAFAGCTLLTNVVFPPGLLSIGEASFSNCTGLTSANIPNGVKSIPYAAFANCSALATLTIPGGVTNIGAYAFSFSGITNLDIPDGTISIDIASFAYAQKLVRVAIPKTVKSIGVFAFSSCTNLIEMYFAGDAPAVGDAFGEDQMLKVYYSPGATGWTSTFGGRPTVMWNAFISRLSRTFGENAHADLTITGDSGLSFLIEKAAQLTGLSWTPICTNRTSDVPFGFTDTEANSAGAFYRLRSP